MNLLFARYEWFVWIFIETNNYLGIFLKLLHIQYSFDKLPTEKYEN